MSQFKNKYLLVGFSLILCAGIYYVFSVNQIKPKSVNLNEPQTLADNRVSLEAKVNRLENNLKTMSSDLQNIRVLNEELMKQLELAAESSGDENAVVDVAGYEFVGQGDLSEITQILKTDQSAQATVSTYFETALLQRDRETDLLFESIPENPEWSGEASNFLSQQLTSEGAVPDAVSHLDCRDAICKVEFSMQLDDELDPGIQESAMLIRLSKKFPKSRLSQTIENGRVLYSGYLLERSVKLPEEQHYLSDGRLTSSELQEIQSLLGR